MKKNLNHLLIPFLILFAGCASGPHHSFVQVNEQSVNSALAEEKPYVLLISIDGYRYDYTDRYGADSIKKFRDEGVSTEGLIPVYPSKTFTNHYSIVTGLYAENHGIVANEFYDPIRKDTYAIGNKTKVRDGTWYRGTPLWVTAEKNQTIAACFFWPGSEAAIQGIYPTYYVNYDASIDIDTRVDQVVRWLKLPKEKRPHFLTLYFPEVDFAGHNFGPDSEETRKAVKAIDQGLAKLFQKTAELNLPLNTIIVSDHGMQAMAPEQVIYLDDFTSLSQAKIVGDGPQVMLHIGDTQEKERIYKDLKKNEKNFQVYRREEIPASYHFSKDPRIGDLLVMAKGPYTLGTHQVPFKIKKGNHGFDPLVNKNMMGIFYAQGPQFKAKKRIPAFRNIQIHSMVTKILGIQPSEKIDGDSRIAKEVLKF